MDTRLSGDTVRAGPSYPAALWEPVADVWHGRRVPDPYRWLEDPASESTHRWLQSQDALADSHGYPGEVRDWFARRLRMSTSTGDISVPARRGGREFGTSRDPGQERSVVYVVERDGRRRTLVDPVALDSTGATSLDRWKVSWSGRYIAYQTSCRGTEWSSLYVLDVDSGQVIEGPIDRLRRDPVMWAPDDSGFWYVRRLPGTYRATTVTPRRVFWHRLGQDPDADDVIFGAEQSPTTSFLPRLDQGRWLNVRTAVGTAPEMTLWLADLHDCDPAKPAFHPVLPDYRASVAPIVGQDGRMYLTTSLDAPRGRVCVVELGDLDRLGVEYWQELIAEDTSSVLLGALPLAGGGWGPERLFVIRTRHATGEAAIHDPVTGRLLRNVPLPGPGVATSPVCPPEGGRSLWFRYADHTTPSTVMRYDLGTDRPTVYLRPPGHVTPPSTSQYQLRYASSDGTLVRIFLVAPASCADGPDYPRPALLTGYGGFGVSMLPRYQADIMPWVEAGGVFAIACVRGGGEEGTDWHRAATGPHKQRSIDDFNGAARWLAEAGWTTAGQLGAYGASNGGLLVTAAMVQHPELYRAVVARAPLTDMLRYDRFGLGPLWTNEYGTAEDRTAFDALLSYSPYHQVRQGASYPAVLLVAPETDTRVDPLHSRKLCAALQDASSGAGPILLRSVRDSGHRGSSYSEQLARMAEWLGFVAAQTGLRPVADGGGSPPG